MSASYIFDSHALLVFFQNEKGADVVARLLRKLLKEDLDRLLCVINLGELLYITKRRFGDASKMEGVPEYTVELSKINNGYPFVDLLVDSKLAPSKAEAKRLIKGGGVYINKVRVEDFAQNILESDFNNNDATIRVGKKKYMHLVLK